MATVRASQRVNSAGLTADGANWKLLGTVQVTGGRLNVRLCNQADGTVIADAIRIMQTATTSAADLAQADLGLLAWLAEEPSMAAALPLSLQGSDATPSAGNATWLGQLSSSAALSELAGDSMEWVETREAESVAQSEDGVWDADGTEREFADLTRPLS